MTTHSQHSQKSDPKEDSAKREILKKPGKDDVHEQREPEQEREGTTRAPGQSALEPKASPNLPKRE
ncbi:hypothetical protein LZC95_04860 [Pendulispora brunnea]|uniref:Uncharacterized protein n=1 Tax=Pendulispora brunnea TaxID=2905690 RepID=A0ABZ2KBU0_9BACT